MPNTYEVNMHASHLILDDVNKTEPSDHQRGSDGYYIVLSDPTAYINQILKRKKESRE